MSESQTMDLTSEEREDLYMRAVGYTGSSWGKRTMLRLLDEIEKLDGTVSSTTGHISKEEISDLRERAWAYGVSGWGRRTILRLLDIIETKSQRQPK